jgi:hypothetical protein
MGICAMLGGLSPLINRVSMYSAEPSIRGWRAGLRVRNDVLRSILRSIKYQRALPHCPASSGNRPLDG